MYSLVVYACVSGCTQVWEVVILLLVRKPAAGLIIIIIGGVRIYLASNYE